jgi:hypothetical protein
MLSDRFYGRYLQVSDSLPTAATDPSAIRVSSKSRIVARVAIDGDLRGAQVESLIRDTESSLKNESDSVFRVDIVPIGQEAELDRG